jgi:hypothetical protein
MQRLCGHWTAYRPRKIVTSFAIHCQMQFKCRMKCRPYRAMVVLNLIDLNLRCEVRLNCSKVHRSPGLVPRPRVDREGDRSGRGIFELRFEPGGTPVKRQTSGNHSGLRHEWRRLLTSTRRPEDGARPPQVDTLA